ncbi:Major cell-binding factor [Methylobacterium crusticola]|uniref:Major cell-binding factor n=1 Tax=Methylobacterium crusticola TaxID=1697972 RepID=A0ABQ4QY51_9HYPH|nr:transporter substrate-binding domain-containing protein [Methylobacterium crusticola]GJD49790.1 Major cell-binding factor [Methylobacterium crusticola]
MTSLSRRTLIGALSGLIGFAASLLPASAETLDTIKSRGKLIVGVKNDYKPWGFLDSSGQIVGLEIDLAKDIAQRLGVGLELVPVVASNRMEFLQQGRIDLLIATLGDNPARRKIVGMVEPNYYAGGTNIMARKSAGLKQWAQLKDRNVCAIQGAYYNRRVAELYKPKLVVFAGISEALNALQQGSCVAFLFDNTLITSTLAAGDAKWADYEMALKTEDEQPWAVAVKLEDLTGPWSEFVRKSSTEWHKTGRLLELEKKWGIDESPFLREMNKKLSDS